MFSLLFAPDELWIKSSSARDAIRSVSLGMVPLRCWTTALCRGIGDRGDVFLKRQRLESSRVLRRRYRYEGKPPDGGLARPVNHCIQFVLAASTRNVAMIWDLLREIWYFLLEVRDNPRWLNSSVRVDEHDEHDEVGPAAAWLELRNLGRKSGPRREGTEGYVTEVEKRQLHYRYETPVPWEGYRPPMARVLLRTFGAASFSDRDSHKQWE